MENITNGNIKIYQKGVDMNATPSEHIIELTSSEYGAFDIYYGPAQLPDGEYYYICSAPGKGRVVRDLIIDATTPANKFIDQIVLREGIAVITAKLLQYNGPGDEGDLIDGVDLFVSRLKSINQGFGEYIITDVPVGTNTIKVVPHEGYEATYQPFEGEVNLPTGSTGFLRVIYPPYNIRIRVTDQNGQTYINGDVYRVSEGGTKIAKLTLADDQRYVFARAWDGTHRFRVFNPSGNPISDIYSHNLSYLKDAPSGSMNLNVSANTFYTP